jgi:hypothetical protein
LGTHYIDQTFDTTVNAISVIFISYALLVLLVIEKTIGLMTLSEIDDDDSHADGAVFVAKEML